MTPCPTCHRHAFGSVCPFCLSTRAVALSGAVLTPIVLSACYGAPPCQGRDLVDLDHDGVPTCTTHGMIQGPEDCNDADGHVNPNMTELCGDKLDNNCASGVDEAGCVTPPAPPTVPAPPIVAPPG